MSPEEELEFLRSRVNELELKAVELDATDFAFAFSLPPMLERVFRLLMAQPRVTTEQIAARLPQGAEVKCAMFRLRKMLKKAGVEVQSQRHIGYWITHEEKKKAMQIARATLAGNRQPIESVL